ncbi:putative NADH dehydrogenase [Trypanosoma rangeli]|uniref:Putative NADH dehydrogenase n=1 Tax=Trypanosoma rangeli TaxID=5698 RepID=A0A3R7KGC5_TRYRA|nr:putative NADH dehydrogenase [Trypanosoma rangeli]RNF05960.1 putative NADH dehydrogenase [Trypanosoma rangeli]|eukprot:RNF05960.1 putative NADH dehydrogenase [Trypanosoma rangeli]
MLRPNVVVVGTGWAGAYFTKHVNPKLANLEVLSIRNHHVFTPLLPQTTTGTLEFRAVCEPISRIQPALAQLPNRFYRCVVHGVDFVEKEVNCVGVGVVDSNFKAAVHPFRVKYDKLILAHGARPNTFNVPGVFDNAFFLREVNEARAIRKRLVQNIMVADLPITDMEEVKRLLHVVVVGGGPTGVEFAASVAEFFRSDVRKINRTLVDLCKVTVLEAGEVFGMFDLRVRNWGKRRLDAIGVQIIKGAVVAVNDKEVITKDGTVIRTGLVVWSTGVGPCALTKDLDVDRTSRGRISIDDHLRVLRKGVPIPDVYAIGDCAANEQLPLPTLAAVASRQGLYLAKQVNGELSNKPVTKPFAYKSLGTMVSLGDSAAVVELHVPGKVDFVGLKALFFWRSAYLSILGSWRNKLYVLVNWTGSTIFGRDTTFIGDLSEDRVWRSLATEEVSRERARQKAVARLKIMESKQTFTSETLEKGAERGYIPRHSGKTEETSSAEAKGAPKEE